MGTAAPAKTEAATRSCQEPVSLTDICDELNEMKGVVAFLADVGCRGAFGRSDGMGLSEDGEVGLNYIFRGLAQGLDRISNYCEANLIANGSH